MAKKRTLVPFYGKINQRLEQRAKKLAETGTKEGLDQAQVLFGRSEEILKLRRDGK